MGISRRGIITAGCTIAASAAVPAAVLKVLGADSPADATGAAARTTALGLHEARHWEPSSKDRVKCGLCPRGCSVGPSGRGYCGIRENRDGKYYTLIYGRPCAVHNDPIEKKPLFHYLPGTRSFSIATAGCNLECLFCQNWNISQADPEDVQTYDMPPEKVVASAKASKCATIAHTYNEPSVTFEYMYDCARLAKEAGIPAVMISNGFINEKPMRELCSALGGVKIDLKSFSEKFYSETCSGRLQPVLDTLKVLKSEGIWYEIVVLLVTTLNDSPDEIKRMTNWIVTELSPDVPVHFSRYFPQYKLTLPRTPVETLDKAYEVAKAEGCHHVYVGNVELPGRGDTRCPGCGEVLIKRMGYLVLSNTIESGRCPKCSRAVAGVWSPSDAFTRPAFSS